MDQNAKQDTIKTRASLASSLKNEYGLDIDEMIKAGVHLGHQTSKLHPQMAENILGIRNTTHIIDLNKTIFHLQEALDFIKDVFQKGGTMILVSTKIPLRELVKETAKECGIPYVAERWVGGTFTNFEVVSKRAKFFKEMKKKREAGEFEKYSKKEKSRMEKKFEELREKFEGILDMEEIPTAVFLCDIVKDKICLQEARKKGIKTIAIVDTNGDPTKVDYPIPANDDAVSSVKYILEKVKSVILGAKPKRV